jgi:hypothetical protein
VPATSEIDLPLAAPDSETVSRALRERLAEEAVPPALARALKSGPVPDVRAELEGIVRELYARSARHRTAIKLIDRCGRDHPELAKVFYAGGRFAQLDALEQYLEARISEGALPSVPDVAVAARFVIESIAIWAVHIHWDPSPQPLDPAAAEETVVELVIRSLSQRRTS